MIDLLAIVGYSILFILGVIKLSDTINRPFDFLANLILLIGFSALATYYFIRYTTNKSELNDLPQKRTREIGHSSLIVFFAMTIMPISKSLFQYYDVFGILGHSYLLYALVYNQNQLFGIAALAIYYLFGSFGKLNKGSMEFIKMIARVILFIFFTLVFIKGIMKLKLYAIEPSDFWK